MQGEGALQRGAFGHQRRSGALRWPPFGCNGERKGRKRIRPTAQSKHCLPRGLGRKCLPCASGRRRPPYSYSRGMNQAGRRAYEAPRTRLIHTSASCAISIVSKGSLRLDEEGNTRRSGYEYDPLPRDGWRKTFEPGRCAGDRNEYSRCGPLRDLHYKAFADPRLACSQ